MREAKTSLIAEGRLRVDRALSRGAVEATPASPAGASVPASTMMPMGLPLAGQGNGRTAGITPLPPAAIAAMRERLKTEPGCAVEIAAELAAAAEADRANPVLLAGLGEAYLKLGQRAQAAACFRRVLLLRRGRRGDRRRRAEHAALMQG